MTADKPELLNERLVLRDAPQSEAYQIVTAMFARLGQGLIVVDRRGICLFRFSDREDELFERAGEATFLWDVLGESRAQIEPWLRALFEEPIPFDDLAGLGPQRLAHSRKKHVGLAYHPMRSENGSVLKVLVLAIDKSSEEEAREALEYERAQARMLIKLVKNKDQFGSFVQEARSVLGALQSELASGAGDAALLLRLLHTLKGGCASFAMHPLPELAHAAEALAIHLREGTQARETLVANLARSVAEMSAQFEGFLQKNRDILGRGVREGLHCIELPLRQLRKFAHELEALPNGRELSQRFITDFISEPIQRFFQHYNDMVLALAAHLGKQMEPVVFLGGDLRVLEEPYAELFLALVHAFRNAVDHGIELPDERRKSQKQPSGRIRVQFQKHIRDEGEWLQIEITDDGKGIDPSIWQAVAGEQAGVECRPESQYEMLQRAAPVIGAAATEANEISGRGVGLDAIRAAAEKLGGGAKIYSRRGEGTRVRVEVPFIATFPSTSY